MEKEEYSKWLEKARENMDVKNVSQTFLEKGEVLDEIRLDREDEIRNKLISLLNEKGFTFEEVEDIISIFGGTIQEIYVELGIKVGARLEMEFLSEK